MNTSDGREEVRKLLVATDGSPAAERAVEWAARFAAAVGAKVSLATVIPPDDANDDLPHARREATTVVERAGEMVTACGVDHDAVLLTGDPRAELLAAVADDVDALVIGTRGRGGFLGLGLGGVAHFLARRTPCPIIAVPAPGGVLVAGTVVVGADPAPANESALRWAASIASHLQGHVVAVAVHPLQSDVISHPAANWRYPGETAVREHVRRAGAAIELELAAGHPVEELTRVAAERDAAMIVVGRRGRGGLHGLLLGRVPAQLLHHSDAPVVVVPH